MNRFWGAIGMAAVIAFGAQSAHSRMWKPDAAALAQDYLIIEDSRNDGEDIIMLMWFAPEMAGEDGKDPFIREVLSDTIIVGTVYAKINNQGIFEYADVEAPVASLQSGNKLHQVSEDDLKPGSATTLFAMKQIFSQNLGAMGQGMKWYNFSGTKVDSCKEDILWIEFAGEKYDFKTPLPGC